MRRFLPVTLWLTKKQSKDHIDISSRKSDIPPILRREVEEAVNSMKDNKAPGNDEITSDIIKQGGEETITQVTETIQPDNGKATDSNHLERGKNNSFIQER